MTQEAKPLSKRAQKMLERLRKGAWYTWDPRKTPKAMQELAEAGLVDTRGRVASIVRCWVPVGYKPGTPEVFPEKWS